MWINQAQEFVISGYTPGSKAFDALIFGYYSGAEVVYAGRTRSGFMPAAREQVYRHFRGLETPDCPFVNLPEAKNRSLGEGLTVEKMKEC